MALMLGALYEALRHNPHIPDDVARKAAEEVAAHQRDMATLRHDLRVITWMAAINLALTFACLLKVLSL